MKDENDLKSTDLKADLKHDTMEFAANHDGDDPVDEVDPIFDEDEVSAEELDSLEVDLDTEQRALNEVEQDLSTDDDILPEEDWTDDLPDKDAE